jgi:hypothetical protein
MAEESPQLASAGSDQESAAPAPKPRKERLAWNALEIAEQVDFVRECLTHGKRPNTIRKLCSEQWGLSTRTADNRIAAARRAMVLDLDQLDRKELAAQAVETLLKVQEQALDCRQGSNAIGATRLMLELAGILGRSA